MTSSPRSGARGSHAGIWLAALVLVAAVASTLLAGGARSASPPQGLIAFSRSDGIYVMRPDGSGVRLLRRAGWSGLAWSPDGGRLALTADGVSVMDGDGDGSDLERLVAVEPGLTRPAWSPDGRRIAFSGQPKGRKRGIWVVNADGSKLHRISTPRLDRMLFEGWGPFDVDWSSTGRLVFTAVEPGRTRSNTCGMVPMYVMNADGSNLREITPRKCPAGEPHDPSPDWSPDGRRIAYVRDHDVWVMNADGRSPVRLSHTTKMEVGPDWSPDGRRIAFSFPWDEVWVMNADGTGARRLTKYGGGPAWQPVAEP